MKIATKRERARTETLHRREALAPEERARLSQRIVNSALHWIQREGFDNVMLYLSMRSEVETTSLLEGLLNSGKQICAPVINTEQVKLTPRRIQNPNTELVRHRYGMLEPKDACPIFPTEHLQLIVVPGIAFDRKGVPPRLWKGFLRSIPHEMPTRHSYWISIPDTGCRRYISTSVGCPSSTHLHRDR